MAYNSYRASGQNQYGQMTDLDRQAASDRDYMLQAALARRAQAAAPRFAGMPQEQTGAGYAPSTEVTGDRSLGQTMWNRDIAEAAFKQRNLEADRSFNQDVSDKERAFTEDHNRWENDPSRALDRWKVGIATGSSPMPEGMDPEMATALRFRALGGDMPKSQKQIQAEEISRAADMLLPKVVSGDITPEQMQAVLIAKQTGDYSGIGSIVPERAISQATADPATAERIQQATARVADIASEFNNGFGSGIPFVRMFREMSQQQRDEIEGAVNLITDALQRKKIDPIRARAEAQRMVEQAAGDKGTGYGSTMASDLIREQLRGRSQAANPGQSLISGLSM